MLLLFNLTVSCVSNDSENNQIVIPQPSVGNLINGGHITGMVMSSDSNPLNGVHVRVVNADNPNIQLSSFSGIDAKLMIVPGVFSIQNIPPGNYRVLIEKLDRRNRVFEPEAYSDFVEDSSNDLESLRFPDEYYNGELESSSDDPGDSILVTVREGSTVTGVDFITNDRL